jgi:hypothetical protein
MGWGSALGVVAGIILGNLLLKKGGAARTAA